MSDVLVSADWVARHKENPNVRLIEIDWDGLNAFETGHIPGALGWNWKVALWHPLKRDFPSSEEFALRLGNAGISNDTTVVIYGAPVQFGTYAWWVFKYFNHADVRILDGGQVKWENEGYALSQEMPEIAPTKYHPSDCQKSLRASRDFVLENLHSPDWTILDHRSHEEYAGQLVGLPGKPDVGAERYGRIPGARHLPFDSLLNEDTSFKSKHELQEIIGAQVSDKSQNIISYCRLAHRATLASFVMTELLGYENVRVYDGSWTEWGSIVGVPIEK